MVSRYPSVNIEADSPKLYATEQSYYNKKRGG